MKQLFCFRTSLRRSAATLLLLLGACAQGQGLGNLSSLGSSILSSTGYVSGSDADSFFAAGQKFAKGVSGMNEEEEYYLGRGVSATVFSTYRPVKNDALTRYVNRVGNTLALFSDRPETYAGYHFVILDTPEINAVSAPGGFVFISKGFLKLLPDEDALAAVLAHEVGHIVLNHAADAVSEANISEAVLITARETAASQGGLVTQELTSLFGESVTEVTNTLLTKGFSRSQEYNADEYAALLLARAGYNPRALEGVLKSLSAASSVDHKGGWYSTHPDPAKRLDEVTDLLDKSPETNPHQALRAKRFKDAIRALG